MQPTMKAIEGREYDPATPDRLGQYRPRYRAKAISGRRFLASRLLRASRRVPAPLSGQGGPVSVATTTELPDISQTPPAPGVPIDRNHHERKPVLIGGFQVLRRQRAQGSRTEIRIGHGAAMGCCITGRDYSYQGVVVPDCNRSFRARLCLRLRTGGPSRFGHEEVGHTCCISVYRAVETQNDLTVQAMRQCQQFGLN